MNEIKKNSDTYIAVLELLVSLQLLVVNVLLTVGVIQACTSGKCSRI